MFYDRTGAGVVLLLYSTALGGVLGACASTAPRHERHVFTRELPSVALLEPGAGQEPEGVLVPVTPLEQDGARHAGSTAGNTQTERSEQGSAPDAAEAELERALRADGMFLDRAAGVLALPASVLVRNDLLEYVLVAANGAAHESLFLTTVRPSLLNAALLLLGVEPGLNARWTELAQKDERGRPLRQVFPPSGDGFFVYAAWREAGETFFFRVEDLLRNLQSGRSLRRHRWVFLGSRFALLKRGEPESFVADVEGNVINLSYFFQGNTVLTAAPEECLGQTIWAANEWLLPPRGAELRLFFARVPLERLDPAWLMQLSEVEPAAAEVAEESEESEER